MRQKFYLPVLAGITTSDMMFSLWKEQRRNYREDTQNNSLEYIQLFCVSFLFRCPANYFHSSKIIFIGKYDASIFYNLLDTSDAPHY